MKASPHDQRLLLDVQRLDNEATHLAQRITALQKGDALAALGARASTLRAELASATGDAEAAERELARLESDTATAQARVTRDEAMLARAASAKDAAGLESEMASLRRRIEGLETSELEVMEQVDLLRARVGDVQGKLIDVESERATVVQDRDAEISKLTVDKAAAEQNRAAVAATVPADLLALYDRQRARYGFGASLLQGGVSTASGVALTGSDLAAVRAAADDDVVLCPDSDAILVRTNEYEL